MTQLVIGSKGQVGSALIEVLEKRYRDVVGINKNDIAIKPKRFDVIHICIPYKSNFKKVVKRYLKQYLAENGLVIIHSTVDVGVCKSLNAVHSPIRGIHPNLVEGIETFDKFFGGDRAEEAAAIFSKLGINCITTEKAENTEALKLWDTTYYGWNIVFEKAVKTYCEENELDFDIVYNKSNEGYNTGYSKLGRGNVVRPVLDDYPGKIGGHCVIPNAEILGGKIANFILKQNKKY